MDGPAIDEALFERIALGDPLAVWELEDGRLREKTGACAAHNAAAFEVALMLARQLDRDGWGVRSNAGYLRVSAGRWYVPDAMVIPAAEENALRRRPDRLEVYRVPLPLVVEVWSPLHDEHDLSTRLRGYQARGDAEIWRLHPYDRTLTRWVRREDGGYDESIVHGGTVGPTALPGVTIDLDRLFAG